MTLRDALAAALDEWFNAADDESTAQEAADFMAADPAFRAALTEAVAEALEKVDVASGYRLSSITPPMCPATLAAAIVARMLP